MQFNVPLRQGKLLKRYKRFLADIELENGEIVTAHCPNPGAMLGLKEPGIPAYVSPAENPNRKLKYTLELVQPEKDLVGINTGNPNKIMKAVLEDRKIPELAEYENVRAEVKYGKNSRIDFLLTQEGLPDCYVEVKNVHLCRNKNLAEFPDSVTKRGSKHLMELADMVKAGHRAIMFYLVQRNDCEDFTIASDIDPAYAENFRYAVQAGVEILIYNCDITTESICLNKKMTLKIPE